MKSALFEHTSPTSCGSDIRTGLEGGAWCLDPSTTESLPLMSCVTPGSGSASLSFCFLIYNVPALDQGMPGTFRTKTLGFSPSLLL